MAVNIHIVFSFFSEPACLASYLTNASTICKFACTKTHISFYPITGHFEATHSIHSFKIPKITISYQPRIIKIIPKSLPQRSVLSTIGGSFDLDTETLTNAVCESKPQSSTNELPLTELNLDVFTSNPNYSNSSKMSTNELPLSDIKFDRPRRHKSFAEESSDEVYCDDKLCKLTRCKQRSFSDPNILSSEFFYYSDRLHLLEKHNQALASALESTCYDYSTICFCDGSLWLRRAPSTILSFLTSSPNSPYPKQIRSISQPSSPSVTTNPCLSYTESNSSTEKRHRHGVAGQMNYFKMLGFGWGGPISFKKMTLGSTNSLFSTAVISGSSSAPNLRDMIPSATSVSEGFGGVPPIRPLETLHNALSLKQIDAFLDRMTAAPLFKTPSSTPPKNPSTPLPTPVGSHSNASTNLSSSIGHPLKLQSPSNSVVWSGPPSFLSSSGQSSPGLSETNSKESSELSSSVISTDGLTMDNISRIFPNTTASLDDNLSNVRIMFDSKQMTHDAQLLEYFGKYDLEGTSGSTTPISGADINLTNIKPGVKNVQNIEHVFDSITESTTNTSSLALKYVDIEKKNREKITSPISLYKNPFQFDFYSNLGNMNINSTKTINQKEKPRSGNSKNNEKHVQCYGKNTNIGSDKWGSEKEKFLENPNYTYNETSPVSDDKKEIAKSGVVTIKESFIELPRVSRISKSFHGKSPTKESYLDITAVTRRASDNMVNLAGSGNTKGNEITTGGKTKFSRPIFCSQKSQPSPSCTFVSSKDEFRKTSLSEPFNLKNARFTTTLVDESHHIGAAFKSNTSSSSSVNISNENDYSNK